MCFGAILPLVLGLTWREKQSLWKTLIRCYPSWAQSTESYWMKLDVSKDLRICVLWQKTAGGNIGWGLHMGNLGYLIFLEKKQGKIVLSTFKTNNREGKLVLIQCRKAYYSWIMNVLSLPRERRVRIKSQAFILSGLKASAQIQGEGQRWNNNRKGSAIWLCALQGLNLHFPFYEDPGP